jgi:hypothetical protein
MANIVYQGTSTSTPDPGIAQAETSYDIKGYSQDVDDPRIYKTDDQGTNIGFWSGHQKMVNISIEGEVASALASIPTLVLAGAGTLTVANLFTMGTVSAGGVYHERSSVRQAEAAIATFTTSATRHPNIA